MKRHAVGVERQRLAPVQDEVARPRRRRSRARRAAQSRFVARICCERAGRSASTSHRVGLVARQAEQHRLVAAVARGRSRRASRTARTARARRRVEHARRRAAARANSAAARIGPTVCELDGPMPILNRSKTETAMSVILWWALPGQMTAIRELSAGGRLRVAYTMSPSRSCHCSTPWSRCRAAVPNCAATCPARKLITLTAAT